MRQSPDLYEFIFEHATEGIFQSTPQGRYLRVNKAMAKIYGYDSPADMVESVLDIPSQIYVTPENRKYFIEALKKNGDVEDFEQQNYRKDGSAIWTSTNARAFHKSDGTIEYYIGFVQDITGRKQTETALGESNERYRTLVEQMPAAVYLDAPTNNLNSGIYISPQIETISGYSPAEWMSTRGFWTGLIHPEDAERFRIENERANATGEPFEMEYRIFHKDGRTVWIHDSAHLTRDAEGRANYWHGILLDVTEQKKFQEAVQEIASSYRGLFDAVSDAVYIQDRAGRFLDVNQGAVKMYGYPRDYFIGKTPEFISAPGRNNLDSVTSAVKRAFDGKPQQFEFWGLRANGEEFPKDVRLAKGLFFGQEVVFALAQDITEKKKADGALIASEAQYRTLIEQASDGIFIANANGNYLDVNPSGCAMLGYTRAELLSMNLTDIIDKDELERKPFTHFGLKTGESGTTERRFVRKNGTWLNAEISAKILPDGRYQGIVRDITERRKVSEERERQLKELSILHEIAVTSTNARNEDDLLETATEIINHTLYPDLLGFLLVSKSGDTFSPHPSYRGHRDPSLIHPYRAGDGITGQVLLTGTPLNVPDVRANEHYIEFNSASRSELCVPMKIGERVIGLINAESSKIGYFTRDDERLLMTIAGLLSTAIERLRSEQAEREQRILAEALRDIAAALNSTLELNTVMDRILENIDRVVPSKSANIMILDNNTVRIIRYRGYTDDALDVWREHFDVNVNTMADLRRAVQTRKPQLIPDVQKDTGWVAFSATAWIRSHLTAPISVNDKAIGFINLDHDLPDFFSPRDLERMTAFTSLAATAIENARLFQEESRRARIIETLAGIANIIATTRDIDRAFDNIAEQTLVLLNASHVAIYLLQEDNQTLKIVTAKGRYQEKLLSHTIKVGEGITGNIVASGRAEIINEMARDTRRTHVPGTPDEDSQRETLMSAPLILRGKAIGAINVWRLRSNNLFEESELNFLVSIAHQASIAIESGRLFEETIHHAQETAAIAEVGRDISSTLQLDVVLERIATYARDLLRSETSGVYLATPNSQELRAIVAIGNEAKEIMNDPIPLGTGILGHIAMQEIGEIINDTVSDSRAITIKGTRSDPLEHLMGVPVLQNGRLTGLLAVWRSGQGREYQPAELGFLNGLAQQAAIAIENARLFQAEQQRRQEAETLREATAVVATTLDRGQAIDLILEQLTQVLQYNSASVQLLREGFLEIVGGRGWPAKSNILGLHFPVPGDNPNTTVILARKPIILNNARESHDSFRNAPHNHIRSWLGIPLIAHGKVIGMLAVDSTEENHFTEEHARLATAFANQAAIAIENARLHEQSETQVQRLTALRDVDTAIASSLDLRVTLNILMEHAIAQLRTDALSILVYNPGMQSLDSISSIGFHSSRTRRGPLHIGEGLGGRVALSRKPVQVLDLRSTPEYEHYRWLSEEGFVAYIGFPLIGKGQIKGVLETFFRQPFFPDTDWLEFTQTIAGQAAIAIDNSQLFENLQRTNQELMLAYDTTLEGWGKALELRDKETQGHTRRVTELTLKLARRMGISDSEITHIHRGVLLHDIGKMGIPDHILRKTGPLTESEWNLMRMHPQYAYDLLQPITYLRPVLDIPYCHHERWDGTGYPRGLKEEEIPLSARIFTIVDVWDALQSDRPYRKPWTRFKTMEYIRKESGLRFDPRVVDVFLRMMSEME
jgi:PAS domain S-box-containing protein